MTTPVYRGVVLAAGGSSRFGGPVAKQLVEIEGEPAVRRAVRRALESRLERVVVVTGNVAVEVRQAVDGLAVETIHNPDWRAGQSGSVRAGLAAVAAGATAVVFIPCDQPFLSSALIDGLVARHEAQQVARRGTGHRSREAVIVVPSWRGRRGAPVLIDSSLFVEFEAIGGDAGARQLFAHHAVAELEIDDEAPLLDFDSERQLRELLRHPPEPTQS